MAARTRRLGPGSTGPLARSEPADGFELLFRESYPLVFRYTAARVGNLSEVEDLVSETFERALLAWPSFQHRSRASTWILSIARHVVADYYRSSSVRHASVTLMPTDLASRSSASPEEVTLHADDLSRLHHALGRLPATDRELLALRYGLDLPFREIGQIVDLNAVTARVRVYRARQQLKSLLDTMEA